MGKKATRPFKGKKKEEKNHYNLTKSGSYSDDYRLTPELLDQGVPQYCNGDCCRRRRACPQGEFCCSRETCLPPERGYRGRPSSLSPCGRMVRENLIYDNHKDMRRLRKEDMEVIVVNNRRLNVRRAPSFCSSCDSCESCASGGSNYTRIDLTNDLFTSPLQTTQASFYHEHPPSPERYHRYDSPPRGRRRNSPHRKVSPSIVEQQLGPYEHYSRKKSEPQGLENNKKITRRAKSFNEVNALTDDAEVKSSTALTTTSKNRTTMSGTRITETADEEGLQTKNNYRNQERKGRERSQGLKPSPSRGTARNNDSPVGKSYSRTSASSGIGASRSQTSRSGESKPKVREEKPNKREDRRDPKEEASKNLKQANLLNKMVNQTREHRKQIKTLESELERLRTTGDTLTSCEVSPGDVEWRPGDVVGEGSFSTVYKGTYCGTEVAVKELKCKLSQDDKNYFRSEAALLQQLHHPRVVLLMGVCTTSARPYMLLEYLSGGTLYSLIHTKTRERLDHAAYFVIAKDVAQGLNYLHKHDPQVLHLDLKSMNVLLDNYTRAKIADFGFSILRRSRGAGSAVQRGSIRGTPAWMSPELLTKGDVSPKCDVYSYAIILWEMLTASHPFHGLDIYHIMEAVEDGARPPLPQSGVSPELRELITSCWAQNPSLRPSFEEILGALETASLPSSWRKVLTKANITPSALSDLSTARAIINMIEQSAELFEKSSSRKHGRSKSDETDPELEPPRRGSRSPKKYSIHDSLIMLPNARGKAMNGMNGGRRNRPVSASREDRIDAKLRDVKSSNFDKRERLPRRGNSSPQRDDGFPDKRVFSPSRKSTSNDVSENPRARKIVTRERRRRSKTRSPRNFEGEERSGMSYSRSPSKGGYSRRDEKDREYRRRDGGKRLYSRSQMQDNITAEESHHYSDDASSYKENRRIPYGNSKGERSRIRADTEVSLSSDESEDTVPSRKSYKKSSDRTSSRRSPNSPSRRSRTRTPQRRSPTRRSYSPKKFGNDVKTQESCLPQRYGGMVLTAEQLLSQKQRLRPVRPTALKDLSLLPQNSINDISLILKQAMLQRRDALEQIQSIKGTSKDIEWSDWF